MECRRRRRPTSDAQHPGDAVQFGQQFRGGLEAVLRALVEHAHDEALDRAGYMRLSTGSEYIFHLGNLLTPKWKQVAAEYAVTVNGASRNSHIAMDKLRRRLRKNSIVKRVLLKLYGGIFNLYYYDESKKQS